MKILSTLILIIIGFFISFTNAFASTTIGTDISTGGSLTVSGTATSTFSGDILVPGLSAWNYLTAPSLSATSTTATSTFAGGLSVAGSSGLTVLQNGYLGIGNTSPVYPLDVNGMASASGGLSIFTASAQQSRSMLSGARTYAPSDSSNYYGINIDAYLQGSGGNPSISATSLFAYAKQNTSGAVRGISTSATLTDAYTVGALYGGFFTTTVNNASATLTTNYGVVNYPVTTNGALTSQIGTYSRTDVTGGTVANNYAFYGRPFITGGTVTNNYGMILKSPDAGGTITNNYGLYIESQTRGSTLNYSIYSAGGNAYFAGNMGIGTTTPTTPLQVTASASNATSTLTVGKVGQNKGSCLELYDAAGTAVYAYVVPGGTTFTISTTSCK